MENLETNNIAVWAFQRITEPDLIPPVYESIQNGKSRFGWSSKDESNLKFGKMTQGPSRSKRLLEIKEGDWIVHLNMPHDSNCTAVRVCSDYDFDEGLEFGEGRIDFRHCFDVDSMIEFDRNDPRIVPTVNLTNQGRIYTVKDVKGFLQSINNIRENKKIDDGEYHLKNRFKEEFLPKISATIQKMNRSKKLERFLAKVFKKIPAVAAVKENGFGWKSDYGADLIVITRTSLGHLELEHRIIVQVKSYEGTHRDLNAVAQVKSGIEHYGGAAGMIMTTAEKSEELENEVQKVSEDMDVPIDLLDAQDLAKFVIKYAPELLLDLDFS